MTRRPPLAAGAAVVRLPLAGTQGRLLAGRDELPVRVFERGPGELMLVLVVPAGERLRRMAEEPGGARLVLEYVCPRGLARLEGEITPVEPDVVRLRLTGEPQLTQRREFVRVQVAQPVELLLAGPPPRRLRGHAVDISGGGMLVDGVAPLPAGAEVSFKLELEPGAPPLEGTAVAVRWAAERRCAFAFSAVDQHARARLIRFVFARQRAALARTRDGGRLT